LITSDFKYCEFKVVTEKTGFVRIPVKDEQNSIITVHLNSASELLTDQDVTPVNRLRALP
jgi:hypothetical protein